MVDGTPPVAPDVAGIEPDDDRITTFLSTLERIAAGKVDLRVPISARHDSLDAIAHGINVLVGELAWAGARSAEAQEAKADELRGAVASAEARTGALLKAIPDLMFVISRDGTYVDFHAREVGALFVPPSVFIGKKVADVLPPPLAGLMMDALGRAAETDDPVVVEYESPMGEPRYYEARIARVDADRLLTIVRDVTESKRAAEINRDVARRLIARQEVERQRIARDLHDDIGQRVALLNIEIDEMARDVVDEAVRARPQALSARASEIATDVHHLSYELHPSKLRMLGLVAALQSLCRDTSQQRSLEVSFSHRDVPQYLDANVALCLYRIVREAIHNAARHSQARDAQVSVMAEDGHIALQVADSGIGFDPRRVSPAGLGLVNMRERVAILKGLLTIDAVPGGGTRIEVRIPLAPLEGR